MLLYAYEFVWLAGKARESYVIHAETKEFAEEEFKALFGERALATAEIIRHRF